MTNAITTITRLFRGKNDDYTTIIPCLKKKSKNPHTKTVVHVGRHNKAGNPICLCSQQEKDNKKYSSKDYAPSDKADWMNADADEYPSITCKSCIRSGAFSGDGERVAIYYLASRLDIKVEAMKEYEKPEPCESSKHTTSSTPEPEPFSRMLPGPTRIVLDAIIERRKGVFAEPTPMVHSAVFDKDVSGGIPLCIKDMPRPILASYYTANYESHPSITCPVCAKIQRERRIEEEPRRDKSLAMRKGMIVVEEVRINKAKEHVEALYTSLSKLICEGKSTHVMLEEFGAFAEDYGTASRNLELMKQGIIAVN